MSSKVENFSLQSPMILEFFCWIRDDIKDRLDLLNYPKMTNALNDAIWDCCTKHTNEDYLTCSNSLTSSLEKILMDHGVKHNDAIRLSWKWSD